MDSGDLFMTGATPDEVWPLVRDYHYSKRMPSNIQYCFAWRRPGGLFGDYGEIAAAAVYGQPVNRNWPVDSVELQRLVRRDDFADRPISEFLSWTLRWLRSNTQRPFALSYADSGQGHHGGIYQATGWTYVRETGRYQDGLRHRVTGDFIHGRQCVRMFGSRSRETLENVPGDYELAFSETKFVYVYPLRQRLKPLLRRFNWSVLPYPKPNAVRPLDEGIPMPVSGVQPPGTAPFSSFSEAEGSDL